MVILWRDGGHIRAVGLATKPRFDDGTPRVPVPNPAAQGLYEPGYLWGDRVIRISPHDVVKHIGWADSAPLSAVQASVGLSKADRVAS